MLQSIPHTSSSIQFSGKRQAHVLSDEMKGWFQTIGQVLGKEGNVNDIVEFTKNWEKPHGLTVEQADEKVFTTLETLQNDLTQGKLQIVGKPFIVPTNEDNFLKYQVEVAHEGQTWTIVRNGHPNPDEGAVGFHLSREVTTERQLPPTFLDKAKAFLLRKEAVPFSQTVHHGDEGQSFSTKFDSAKFYKPGHEEIDLRMEQDPAFQAQIAQLVKTLDTKVGQEVDLSNIPMDIKKGEKPHGLTLEQRIEKAHATIDTLRTDLSQGDFKIVGKRVSTHSGEKDFIYHLEVEHQGQKWKLMRFGNPNPEEGGAGIAMHRSITAETEVPPTLMDKAKAFVRRTEAVPSTKETYQGLEFQNFSTRENDIHFSLPGHQEIKLNILDEALRGKIDGWIKALDEQVQSA